jgi:hypothetical protein
MVEPNISERDFLHLGSVALVALRGGPPPYHARLHCLERRRCRLSCASSFGWQTPQSVARFSRTSGPPSLAGVMWWTLSRHVEPQRRQRLPSRARARARSVFQCVEASSGRFADPPEAGRLPFTCRRLSQLYAAVGGCSRRGGVAYARPIR